jgi:hypothetical protein
MFQKDAADRAASRRTGAAFPESFGSLFITPKWTPRRAASAFSPVSAALLPHAEKQGEPKPKEDKTDEDKDK